MPRNCERRGVKDLECGTFIDAQHFFAYERKEFDSVIKYGELFVRSISISIYE